jgi:hypothetical protein
MHCNNLPKVRVVISKAVASCDDAILTFDGQQLLTIPSGDTANIDCTTLLNAVYITSNSLGHQHTGLFVLDGVVNSKDSYVKSDDNDRIVYYDGTKWVLEKLGGGAHTHDAADGNEDYPWEADWSLEDLVVDQASISNYCSNGGVCDDVSYSIVDTDMNVLYSGSISPGGALNQTIQDSTVENSDATYQTSVLAEGLLVTPDIDLSVNSIVEGSVPSVKDIDIELEDSLSNPITPSSVTMVGDVLTIEVPSFTPPSTGTFLVRFFDIDGTILKEERRNAGQDATAPPNPNYDPTYLVFAEWNQPFTNVQNDIDVGAIYDTIDGKTYLFVRITDTTGLQPTLSLSKTGTALLTVDWGDSTTDTTTTNGNFTLTKTAAYAAIGDYIITIESTDVHSVSTLTGRLLGNNTTYSSSLLKLYAGEKFNAVTISSLNSHRVVAIISLSKISTAVNFGAFNFCQSLIHLNLPSGSTAVGASIFVNCESLRYISFPSTFLLADFTNCFALESIRIQGASLLTATSIETAVIPNSVTSIPASYLDACRRLKKVTIPNAVTSLGNFAFRSCTLLTELEFPSTLTSMGGNVFSNSNSIMQFTFLSTTPPTAAFANNFTGINAACKIYVPDASVAAYKAATNWSTYANYIYPLSTKP